MILLTIIVFIAVLGLLVFVHEFGHFIMAKRAGMKVEEFGFGFPPRIFGIRRGATLYSINWIPLGGFVKILGEDGSDTQDPASFGQKSAWRRFAVLIAGVTMNLILAWVLLSIAMGLGTPTVLYEGDQLPASAHVKSTAIGILDVAPNSPAAIADLRPGDTLAMIGSEPVASIDDAQQLTLSHAGNPTVFEIRRGDNTIDKTITPRADPPPGEGSLGIALGAIARVSYPWYELPYRGLIAAANMTWLTLSAFGGLLSQLFHGHSVADALSGPVGIAVLTGDVVQLGWVYLIQFTAVLSINLAFLNVLPFPALDGGRILFLIIEKIRRRKLPVNAEQTANAIGFLLLITLMIFVTVKDFGRFDIIHKVRNLF